MTTAEEIVIALREGPLTRLEILLRVINVTPRAITYQLGFLRKHGIVKKYRSGRNTTYKLIAEEKLLTQCRCCQVKRPCWQIKKGLCNYCRNIASENAKALRVRKTSRNTLYGRDDACSLAYQPLLRSSRIGFN